MSTHLQRKHKTKPDVARALLLPKCSHERREAFVQMLKEGDFIHNTRVLKSGSGTLIVKYRKQNREVDDCLACPFCCALYLRSLLYKHVNRCPQKPDGANTRRGACILQARVLMPNRLEHKVSHSFFKHVIAKMKDDDISRLIKGDSLLLMFGERMFGKRDVEEHTGGQVSARLRELGRLLQLERQTSEMRVSSMKAVLDPANFDLLLSCVKTLAEFSETSHCFKKGSLALKLGHSLKKCSTILRAEAIKVDDVEQKNCADRFDALFQGDWYDHISASAAQSVEKAKMNNPPLIPSLKDVESVLCQLEKHSESNEYEELAKSTLCAITIFNRKRGGEVQRMKCEDFRKGHTLTSPEEEVLENLTATEKKLVDILERVEIRGKFNRPVPILLTPAMVKCIQRLLKLREEKNIDSPYLFASPTGEHPYRGSDVIRHYSAAVGVKDRTIFTATSLRKQLATLSQALQVNKMGQDQLAAFLGHDIRVHRNIYRQPLAVIQKAKVATVLFQLNRGTSVLSTEDVESQLIPSEEDVVPVEKLHPPKTLGPVIWDDAETDPVTKHSPPKTLGPVILNDAENDPVRKHSSPKKSRHNVKKAWSSAELASVKKELKQFLVLNRVPGKCEALAAISASSALRGRSWKEVKYCVYNMLQKQRRALVS